jgi:hypothetical protein
MPSPHPLRSVARGAVVLLALLALAGSVVASPTPAPSPTPATSPTGDPSPLAGPASADTVPDETATPSATEPGPAAVEPLLDEVVLGPAAVEALGDNLAEAAARNDLTPQQLVESLQDPTFGLGPSGRLLVAEQVDPEQVDPEQVGEAPGDGLEPPGLAALVAPLDQTFTLQSLPGSRRTIYLDFTGPTVTDTGWNAEGGIPDGRRVPPFSLDGSPEFSETELQFIQNVWQVVAEDFAPFDVNVTTQAPPPGALTRTSSDDQVYGARAIITTPAVQADFPSGCPIESSCLGIAYVGTFSRWSSPGHAYYEGAFVNASDAVSPQSVGLIASHEIGHNAGLRHAGTRDPSTGAVSAYYDGTGNWGPIMGSPLDRALTQWTQHAYPDAFRSSSQANDDVREMSRYGIAPLADDVGATLASAGTVGWGSTRGSITPAPQAGAPPDVDAWLMGRCTGTVTVTATPSSYQPNLDVALRLATDDGRGGLVQLAADDPISSQTGSGSDLRPTGVSATITYPGNGSNYVAIVAGSTSGPDGGYGNLGPYTLSTSCRGTTAPVVARSFTDVSWANVFFDDIEWLSGAGVTTGYDNGDGSRRYEPSSPVLREQMAAFLYRFENGGANPPANAAPAGFLDVASTDVFKEHIRWLAASGVTTGYPVAGGTEFRGSQPVLREQLAAFLYRLAGATDTATSCGLVDVRTTDVFAKEICWLKEQAVTTGYDTPGGTEFRGSQPVLREQLAAFLSRYDRL